MIIWVIAGLLGLATGLRIGWALVNKQSLVSTAMILALGSLGFGVAACWVVIIVAIRELSDIGTLRNRGALASFASTLLHCSVRVSRTLPSKGACS